MLGLAIGGVRLWPLLVEAEGCSFDLEFYLLRLYLMFGQPPCLRKLVRPAEVGVPGRALPLVSQFWANPGA